MRIVKAWQRHGASQIDHLRGATCVRRNIFVATYGDDFSAADSHCFRPAAPFVNRIYAAIQKNGICGFDNRGFHPSSNKRSMIGRLLNRLIIHDWLQPSDGNTIRIRHTLIQNETYSYSPETVRSPSTDLWSYMVTPKGPRRMKANTIDSTK